MDALTAGDTLTIDGIEHIVVGYGVSGRLVTVTHQGRAVDVYADGKIVHGKLKTTKAYGRKDETSMPPRVQVSPDQLGAIRALLLEGRSTSSISVVYGHARSWVGDVAKLAGLRYVKTGPQSGHWVQQQGEAAMTDEKWDMTTEDYTALITPDRERGAANGASDAPAPEPEAPAITDPTMREAYDLLAQATKQRASDMATIDELNTQCRTNIGIVSGLNNDVRDQTARIAQLESENKRLMSDIKTEIAKVARLEDKINHGLLRQGMDELRKLLPRD